MNARLRSPAARDWLERALGVIAGSVLFAMMMLTAVDVVVRYVLNRSPDGMHSLLSRIAAERFQATRNPHWLQIALMPDAVVIAFSGRHAMPVQANRF